MMDVVLSVFNWVALVHFACFLAVVALGIAAWAWQVNEVAKENDADNAEIRLALCDLVTREQAVARRERECDDMHDLLHGWQTSLVDAYGQKLLDEITGGRE